MTNLAALFGLCSIFVGMGGIFVAFGSESAALNFWGGWLSIVLGTMILVITTERDGLQK